MKGAVYIGVDCGGTSLRAMAADAKGEAIGEIVLPTGDAQDRENGLGEAILALVADLVACVGVKSGSAAGVGVKSGSASGVGVKSGSAAGVGGRESSGAVGGIGIGLPFVCWDGKAHLCRNVEALDPLWLEARLRASYGAPTALMNDVKCAALGESWQGAAKGADPFVYLNIGTGLSSALYAGGGIYKGAHHAAGEIAYWIAEARETGGLSEGYGPLEEAMSGVGLSGAYSRATAGRERISAEEIFRRAGEGETLAADVIEAGILLLLPAIANLLTFADPELLVIGGGVSRGLARHSARIESYVKRMTPFPPRIAWSALGGRAGLIGAIRLAMLAGGGNGGEAKPGGQGDYPHPSPA